MMIQWTEDLATDVREIDAQHQELFARVNDLLAASSQGAGTKEISRVIKFLEDYVKTHFSTEESYMVRHAYRDYQGHKAQHAEFIRDFNALKDLLEKEGSSSYLVIKTNRAVCDWLTNHIKKVDKAMGAYLKTRL
ncbi:MAG: hemerythrin family protein [Thermodesulfovibrionales bacterium]